MLDIYSTSSPTIFFLMSLLAELQSLACLTSQRAEVTVHLGAKVDDAWSFNWQTAQIEVNPADYRLRSPDYCRGLLLHESAHAAITRYQAMLPKTFLEDAAVLQLMNVIEDCRIENWLQQRLPGCAPWIALYNNHLFGDVLADRDQVMETNAAAGFLMGILSRWWFGRVPAKTHPLAVAALDEVWDAVERAVSIFPREAVGDRAALRARYETHPVSVCYASLQATPLGDQRPLDGLEMLVRMTQYEMWELVEKRVLPVYRRLLAASGEEEKMAALMKQFVVKRRVKGGVAGSGKKRAGRGNWRTPPGRGLLYAETAQRYHGWIERLGDTLLRYLTAEVQLKTLGGQPSGARLDLAAAQRFEADPRQYRRLWQRQRLPQRPDPFFVLVVDVSGSMNGPRAKATFTALVILREVCLRTGIALSIVLFGAGARVVQDALAPDQKTVVPELEAAACPSDAQSDLAAGLQLAHRLREQSPHRQQLLWVLSDGIPNCAPTARRLVQEWCATGGQVVGLGLGPETEELADIIPGAFTQLQPRQLPKLFARLFETQVRGH
jgi:uncharacterized protein YegL